MEDVACQLPTSGSSMSEYLNLISTDASGLCWRNVNARLTSSIMLNVMRANPSANFACSLSTAAAGVVTTPLSTAT